MIGHRDRDGAIRRSFLHDNVAASPPNFGEPMAREYPADLSA